MESEKGDPEVEPNEEAELTVLAYSLYMKEVMTTLMKADNPKSNIIEQDIADAIKVTLEFSKEIYKVFVIFICKFGRLSNLFRNNLNPCHYSLSRWLKMFPRQTIKI